MNMKTDYRDGVLTVTRIYRAPIEKVFEAWIETSKIKQWWGCAECIDVKSEVEPKVGGVYNHQMTIETPHGVVKAPQNARLTEYDPPHRLAYALADERGPMSVTVDFKDIVDGTEVRLVHADIPEIPIDDDQDLPQIIQAGWTAAFGKLALLFAQDEAA